ncbi:hypothetical protein ACMU_08650 [Actibacterium mucosum KCTC 23349]|uniref:Tellurium resistance protein n=1 Tax=Actibacterium mucosum KCTC 23349 TaxID=1454373 RepID=A0A037ZJV7_9RHOB|nr:TrgA family protein [Actibacterium mucosum]KAJ55832.1 hypothetical protein ACMU_08650 [Actibacterium mucosum KCTC 23349]
MPTAARLIAAICYAAVAFFASESFTQLLPDGTPTDWFSEINAAFGAFAGWRIHGRQAGNPMGPAISVMLVTEVVGLFYVLVFHSLYQMIQNALDKKYGDTMEAIVGMFQLAGQYGKMLATFPEGIGILLVGGLLSAWATEAANRRWR